MRICVTTVVDAAYQQFVPLWAYCIHRAYPDYTVKVFLTDRVGPALRDGLQIIAGMGNLETVSGELSGYPPVHRLAAILRFLLFAGPRADWWRGYDGVYIADADLFIVRESPALHVQHERHMHATGLPYSNARRPYGQFKSDHITGLHYASQEFVERVRWPSLVYDRWFRQDGIGALWGFPKIDDERLLCQIINDSGLRLPGYMTGGCEAEDRPDGYRLPGFRPDHGVHLGFARIIKELTPEVFPRQNWEHSRRAVRDFWAMRDDRRFLECLALIDTDNRAALWRTMHACGTDATAEEVVG